MTTIPTRPVTRPIPPTPRPAAPATFGADYAALATAVHRTLASAGRPVDPAAAATARGLLVSATLRLMRAAQAHVELPASAAALTAVMVSSLEELQSPSPLSAVQAGRSADPAWSALARAATVMERQVAPVAALPPDQAAQVLADLTVIARAIPHVDDRLAGSPTAHRAPAAERLRVAAGALTPVVTLGRPWQAPDHTPQQLALIVAAVPREVFDLRGLEVTPAFGPRDLVMANPDPTPGPPSSAVGWEELPGRAWYDHPTVAGPRPVGPDRRLLPQAVAPTMARLADAVAAAATVTVPDAVEVAHALSVVASSLTHVTRPGPYLDRVADLGQYAQQTAATLATTLTDLDPPTPRIVGMARQLAHAGPLIRTADPVSAAAIRAALPSLTTAAATAVHQAAASPTRIVVARLEKHVEPGPDVGDTMTLFPLDDIAAIPTQPVLDRERGGDRDPAVLVLLEQSWVLAAQAPRLAADAPRQPSRLLTPSAAAHRSALGLAAALDQIDLDPPPGSTPAAAAAQPAAGPGV